MPVPTTVGAMEKTLESRVGTTLSRFIYGFKNRYNAYLAQDETESIGFAPKFERLGF